MTVNHVYDFKFMTVQSGGYSRAASLNNNNVKALIAQRPDGRTNALISENASNDDIIDFHVA